jgi:hypothetical protein
MSAEDAVFFLNIAGAFVAAGVLAALYIWPAVRSRPRYDALRILALPHAFRFVGLSFLIEGVVSPELDPALAVPAAWGDFFAANLALLSIAALTWRWAYAIPLVWLFNLWGTIDLINAYVIGGALQVEPGRLGAAYYIPTMIVLLLLVTHCMIFMILLRSDGAPGRRPELGQVGSPESAHPSVNSVPW